MSRLTIASMLMASAVIVGCNKDDTTAPPRPTADSSSTPSMTTPAATPPAMTTPTTAPANDAMAAATTKANELLQQGMQYVKENKLDLADKTLTTLDGMKSQLPADWPPKIDQLRSAIQAAKLGSGKMPSLPK